MTENPETPTPAADAEEPVENAPEPAPQAPAEARPPAYPDGWTELDTRAVDLVRTLAMDAVQKVGNGHPGTAMSLAHQYTAVRLQRVPLPTLPVKVKMPPPQSCSSPLQPHGPRAPR